MKMITPITSASTGMGEYIARASVSTISVMDTNETESYHATFTAVITMVTTMIMVMA